MAELTTRESEVLILLRMGKTYVEIGEQLDISQNTVKTHLKSIYRKLGVRNRTEAVLKNPF